MDSSPAASLGMFAVQVGVIYREFSVSFHFSEKKEGDARLSEHTN